MMPEELPLQDLFNLLRVHGLPLGTEEYMAALHAFQAGFGISDLEALKKLCTTLWIKSSEEERLFNWYFEETMARFITSTKQPTLPEQADFGQTTPQRSDMEFKVSERPDTEPPQPLPTSHTYFPDDLEEPVQVAQTFRNQGQVASDLGRLRFSLLTEYFPVTRRQMKQSWRYLRRSVREGPPEELDVFATVQRIGRDGVLLEPVLVPRRTNRTELALFIDQGGSMVPFHALTRQLVETAQRGGQVRKIRVYYFHDYPTDYLYRDPARLESELILDVLQKIGKGAKVLIVSDAGAARGNIERERIGYTKDFIEKIHQTVSNYAWLNPMPYKRWLDTTAREISRFVPMFDMDTHNFANTILALRGQFIYGEKS